MFHKSPEIHHQHHPLKGENGLPENYPVPPLGSGSLFYIQRNHNMNTISYEVNHLHDGRINEEFPMHVFWIRYAENGEQKELNFIQNKLAYGYTSKMINPDCFEFSFVSYEKKKFYIDKKPNGQYAVYTQINNENAQLSNIYAYADELGAFPKLRYVEFYGYRINSDYPVYQKINIEY